jgi:hypothetical protein
MKFLLAFAQGKKIFLRVSDVYKLEVMHYKEFSFKKALEMVF